MEYEHPLYNPTSVAAQARLPEINTDRIAFAGAYHGWGFHEDGARSGLAAVERLGLTWPATGAHASRRPAGARSVRDDHPAHPAHAVRAVVHAPVADLAGRRRRPARPRRCSAGSRRATTSATPSGRSARTSRRFLDQARHRRPRRPDADGRQRPGLRLLLQPDQRLLVLGPRRRPGRDGGRGAQHLRRPARLPRATPTSRAAAPSTKAMYVSPFHGTDGTYRVAAPVPCSTADDRLDIAVTLDTDDGATVLRLAGRTSVADHTAPGCPRSNPGRPPDPDARHLAVAASTPDPAPPGPRPGGAPDDRHQRPSLGQPLARARRRAHRTARGRLGPGRASGCSPRPSTASTSPCTSATLTLGRGGPAMTVHRPDEFFARLGRHQLIGFGEAYLTGAWDTARPEDLAAVPHRPGRRAADAWCPSRCSACARLVVQAPAAPRAEQHRELPRQHRAPLRPVQRPVRAVPRPDAELLVARCSPSELLDGPPGARTSSAAQHAKIDRLLDAGPGRRGHPRPRDRHRLGRARDPRRPARRHGPHHHPVGRAEGPRRPADRRTPA